MPRITILAVLILVAPATAWSQDVPARSATTRLIPFSGVLADGSGVAAPGAHAITFSLFDEREGGALLWTETQSVAADERGRYTAHLGAVGPLPLEIFRTEQARWLEVTVDGRALPRVMLVAVPYALRAADAETLGGKPLSEFVLTGGDARRVRADGTMVDGPAVDGTGVANQVAKWADATTLSSSIITESFDNRIGILAPDPTGGGVVDSRFTIRHLDNNTAIGVLNTSNQRRFALNTLSTGGFRIYDGGAGTWNAGAMQVNGRLYLGDATPSAIPILDGALVVAGITAGNAIFARKSAGASNAIQARSAPGILGPIIVGSVGLADNTSVGSNSGVLGTNFDAGGIGVMGWSGASGTAIYASGPGFFSTDVDINGTLTKGGGAFKIDHPLDPANKYLRHSFVESPDMMNVYNGNAVLDAQGDAWVTLPEWFEALNRDFRYQLTSIGAPGPNLHIASKVSGNRFRIAGGTAGAEVSWQVTGIRQDAWANANRIVVEENKPAKDRGFYLHPDAFGQSADLVLPALRSGVTKRQE